PSDHPVLGRHVLDRDGGEVALLVQDADGPFEQRARDGGRELGAGCSADLHVEDGHDVLLFWVVVSYAPMRAKKNHVRAARTERIRSTVRAKLASPTRLLIFRVTAALAASMAACMARPRSVGNTDQWRASGPPSRR